MGAILSFLPPSPTVVIPPVRTDASDAGGGGKEKAFFIFGAAISYRALGLYILSARRPSRRLLYPAPAPNPEKEEITGSRCGIRRWYVGGILPSIPFMAVVSANLSPCRIVVVVSFGRENVAATTGRKEGW